MFAAIASANEYSDSKWQVQSDRLEHLVIIKADKKFATASQPRRMLNRDFPNRGDDICIKLFPVSLWRQYVRSHVAVY